MINGDRDIIDQYLRGELQGDALETFRSRLPADAMLRREMENMLFLLPGIHDAGKTMLKAKLKLIQATLPAKLGDYSPSQNGQGQLAPRKVKWPRWKWIALTTGIVVLVAASVLLWMHYTHHPVTEGEGGTEAPKQETPVADSAKKDSVRGVDSCNDSLIQPAGKGVALQDEASKAGKKKDPAKRNDVYDSTDDSFGFDKAGISRPGGSPGIPTAPATKKPYVTVVIPNDPNYKFHYKFRDTLFLYGSFNKAPVTASPGGPILTYKGNNYLLRPVKKITPLTSVVVSLK